MTHKERAITALTLGTPDYVPTFELEFQLEEEMFGDHFLRNKELDNLTSVEQEKAIKKNAEFLIKVYSELDHSIIPISYLSQDNVIKTAKHINSINNDEFLLTVHGDGTFAIPDGNGMMEFVYWLSDEPKEGLKEARINANRAIERNKKYIYSGVQSLILCSDYCFNSGPFVSPDMFSEFIQPFLYDIIKNIREDGGYAIKHTDGNIMPILDMLTECNPHALHSLDPMAGVDMKVIKETIGDKIALCGNVHCAHLQTGSDQDVIDSCEYAMKYGKPGGGYFFCTSNIPFKGMPVERYEMIMNFWRKNRYYNFK